ncbi:MAG: aconitate hydratase AcnA [Leptospiraceae bacterium]|nr:aconitate hydratase AcnA [Leptospiraceae bacterium]
MNDPFKALTSLDSPAGKYSYYKLGALGTQAELDRLPFSMRVLLEAALRNLDNFTIHEKDVRNILNWDPAKVPDTELAFHPGRVILQDFTGVPAVVDLAALRSAMVRMGGDPARINPRVQVDLVIDHSVQVDHYGSSESLQQNIEIEFERNRERYEFLKWGQQAFQNFSIVPPGAGIVHQVNLEYLASVALNRDGVVFPDSLVGTDSHTTMINGLGVLGWGVGGIEAEAVMLGQPIYMLIPQVVGFKLSGKLAEGITATDLVLRIVEMLRQKGVVGKFVEFYGPALDSLPLPDRATIANMAPEYGATCGFFPVDQETLRYMQATGRDAKQIALVEAYYKAQGLFHTASTPDPVFSDTLELDIGTIEPALSGPKRPQDRINLKDMHSEWQKILTRPVKERGFELSGAALQSKGSIQGDYQAEITHGNIVIAAITSCTNTSNPGVMIGAGLVAKKAADKGLKTKEFVKTSLAPGSRVVSDYLDKAGLTDALNQLGFQTVGYGCTTCIGNSGPIPEPVVSAINEGNLVATSVLSGNRNFEGRISPHVKANFLASPPLVVAYAIAGTVNIDLNNDPIGQGSDGQNVYLKDIWPTTAEVQDAVDAAMTPAMYQQRYGDIANANQLWLDIPVSGGQVYEWKAESTYIQEPDFFKDMAMDLADLRDIQGARCLVKVGDSVTTDHISPAGAIPEEMPAGVYLKEKGVSKKDFNSFGSRRGNDRVMTRGTFGNIRLRNQMAPGTEGGWTSLQPENRQMTIYDASMEYQKNGVPLIVLAGTEYGTGSSRDWAAKGTFTLGVKAVIASSFERIHRSNLVGMGVLPLQFKDGATHESLGLTGQESFDIIGIANDMQPMQDLTVVATANDGSKTEFKAQCRLDTPVEIQYFRNGGILHTVLRNFAKESKA